MTSQASVSLPVKSNGTEQSPSEVSSSPNPVLFKMSHSQADGHRQDTIASRALAMYQAPC